MSALPLHQEVWPCHALFAIILGQSLLFSFSSLAGPNGHSVQRTARLSRQASSGRRGRRAPFGFILFPEHSQRVPKAQQCPVLHGGEAWRLRPLLCPGAHACSLPSAQAQRGREGGLPALAWVRCALSPAQGQVLGRNRPRRRVTSVQPPPARLWASAGP